MLWAYFSFSQFLIIWSGNLPEEIPFFVDRLRGGWQYVSAAILLGHFALPFTLLLSRDLKRRPRLLAQVAVVILADARVDLMWLVEPMFGHDRFPHPLDGYRAAGGPRWACGCSCSHASCAAGRCCRSTIRSSRRRSRMTPTDPRRHASRQCPVEQPGSRPRGHRRRRPHDSEFGVGLAVIGVVCAVIVWAVFGVLERQAAARDPQMSPLAAACRAVAGRAASRDERACRACEVPCGGDESARWLRLDQSARRCGAHADRRSQEAARPARPAGARRARADALEGTHAPAMGEASGGRTIAATPAAAPAAAPVTRSSAAGRSGKSSAT